MKWRERVKALKEMGFDNALEQAKCYARLMADKSIERINEDFDVVFIPFMVVMCVFFYIFFRILGELVGVEIYVYLR